METLADHFIAFAEGGPTDSAWLGLSRGSTSWGLFRKSSSGRSRREPEWFGSLSVARSRVPIMTPHAGKSLFSALGRVVVLVDDPDAALAFYGGVLGFCVLHDQTTDGYRYVHIGVSGQEAVGLWLMTATSDRERELIGRQCGDQPLLVLYTGDLDVVREHLRGHGVRVWNEREDADSRSLHLADLYGNVIIVAQVRESAV
jgi:predicted enzyme related to lactoylglutathione lyase